MEKNPFNKWRFLIFHFKLLFNSITGAADIVLPSMQCKKTMSLGQRHDSCISLGYTPLLQPIEYLQQLLYFRLRSSILLVIFIMLKFYFERFSPTTNLHYGEFSLPHMVFKGCVLSDCISVSGKSSSRWGYGQSCIITSSFSRSFAKYVTKYWDFCLDCSVLCDVGVGAWLMGLHLSHKLNTTSCASFLLVRLVFRFILWAFAVRRCVFKQINSWNRVQPATC